MRAVLQRVLRASIAVEGVPAATIGRGLLVLAGLRESDTDEDLEYIMAKMTGARIFDDDRGVMNRSIEEMGGEILVVPQFTLYGDLRRGRRPSYSDAMKPERARTVFATFMERLKDRYPSVKSGVFGAHMEVSLVNDGPVTILLDSERRF